MPKKLILYIKRFDFNYETLKSYKIDINTKAPIELIIKKEFTFDQKKDIKYKLVSFNMHSGSIIGGHYYAYTKGKENWYKVSDASVSSEIKENEIKEKINQGYLYCYEKVD